MSNPLVGAVEALEACPFCGRDDARVFKPTCRPETPYNPADRLYPVVRCQCGAEMSGKNEDYTGKTAAEAWGRRARPSSGWDEAIEAAAKTAETDVRSKLAKDCSYTPQWFQQCKDIAAAIRLLKGPREPEAGIPAGLAEYIEAAVQASWADSIRAEKDGDDLLKNEALAAYGAYGDVRKKLRALLHSEPQGDGREYAFKEGYRRARIAARNGEQDRPDEAWLEFSPPSPAQQGAK